MSLFAQFLHHENWLVNPELWQFNKHRELPPSRTLTTEQPTIFTNRIPKIVPYLHLLQGNLNQGVWTLILNLEHRECTWSLTSSLDPDFILEACTQLDLGEQIKLPRDMQTIFLVIKKPTKNYQRDTCLIKIVSLET